MRGCSVEFVEPAGRGDEVEAIVDDYFDMLNKEIRDAPYVKAEHRRSLRPLLDRRTYGAVELKHCNISAVLSSMGLGTSAGTSRRKLPRAPSGDGSTASRAPVVGQTNRP